PAEHTAYPSVFSPAHHPDSIHNRHTQLLTSDLLESLEYDYSEALSRLSAAAAASSSSIASALAVPGAPLYPLASSTNVDFEPGSSAGTIRNVQPRVFVAPGEADGGEAERSRMPSDSSAESKWSTEATDAHAHAFLHVPMPLSPPELPSSSSEADTETSPAPSLSAHSHEHSPTQSLSLSLSPSPCTPLSRSRSSSTVSSEYDFGDDEYEYGCYSYDIGPFADPLASPPLPQDQLSSFQQQQQQQSPPRPVFGYGIPWPSTHARASGVSGGSGGSVSDVLSDLEDLAEDLTERFSL
ncbi:hypothetical protein FKP32DRAFT_1680576, partial [Trametes sanguinea]